MYKKGRIHSHTSLKLFDDSYQTGNGPAITADRQSQVSYFPLPSLSFQLGRSFWWLVIFLDLSFFFGTIQYRRWEFFTFHFTAEISQLSGISKKFFIEASFRGFGREPERRRSRGISWHKLERFGRKCPRLMPPNSVLSASGS